MSTHSGATVEVQAISKWYGNVVAVNDVSFEVYPGVTGILGPQRRGEDDAAQHDVRSAAAIARETFACWARRWSATSGCTAASASCWSTTPSTPS